MFYGKHPWNPHPPLSPASSCSPFCVTVVSPVHSDALAPSKHPPRYHCTTTPTSSYKSTLLSPPSQVFLSPASCLILPILLQPSLPFLFFMKYSLIIHAPYFQKVYIRFSHFQIGMLLFITLKYLTEVNSYPLTSSKHLAAFSLFPCLLSR